MRACLFALPLLFAACAPRSEPSTPAPAPEPARPRSLHELARAEIHEGMRGLVVETEALGELLARSEAPDEATHTAVVARVEAIERILGELDASALAKTHPLLGAGLPGFRKEVTGARAALDGQVPDYAPARAIPAACKRCHMVASRGLPPDLRFAQR